MEEALKNFDRTESSGAAILSLDLSKAFDCLDHELACSSFKEKGFPPDLIKWLENYLQGRSAAVKVNDEFSGVYPINRGVPQGTVLGTLIFNTYISDFIAVQENAKVVIYADDINIVMKFTSKDPETIKCQLEKEISGATAWCIKKKTVLNTEKSSCLLNLRHSSYRPASLALHENKSMKILGVHVSSDLDWSTHVNEITRKANQKMHVLKQIRPFVDKSDLHKIYIAYIRSVLEYCNPVFVKLSRRLSDRLQKVENHAHRIIFYQSEERTRTCEKDNLRMRRERMSLRLFDLAEKNPRHPLFPLLPNKHKFSRLFSIQYCRTQKFQDSFINYCTQLSNTRQQLS